MKNILEPRRWKPVLFAFIAGVVLALGVTGYLYIRFLKAEPTVCSLTARQVWAESNPKQVDHARKMWEDLQKKAQDEVEKAYYGVSPK